ncbi:hypothetical protein SVIOM74S_02601 [Streptomyces violarus]
MRVTSVESTELFTGTTEQPRQVVAVELSHTPGRTVRLTVEGPGLTGTTETAVGADGTVRAEIPVTGEDLVPGDRREITVTAADGDEVTSRTGEFTAAEPAGPCSWSATSTTTRSGGTHRAPTRRPGTSPTTRRPVDCPPAPSTRAASPA